MPRLTVSQRLRGRLRALLKAEGWGSAANLSHYSQHSPGGTSVLPQEISTFINNTPGRGPINIDHLDDVAAYFRVTIGELVGETRTQDLSADEQRMVYAFRALSPQVQEHFLALIEQASVGQPRKWGFSGSQKD